ncbi:MAG TPA: hypothetical protein DEA96_05575 [Leptospiraceae bacterium]|nr:hypothetical protein [Spirochaetaceae bacterium]HBS04412.1 hypothetical protein [Leptospiraceae bacterium]
MSFRLKRIYDPPEADDGIRILVDRIWPRGVSKDKANISLWLKDIAPSTELRKWFDHDPKKWDQFKARYWKELEANSQGVSMLSEEHRKGDVTLLYSARDRQHNQARALLEFLEKSTW